MKTDVSRSRFVLSTMPMPWLQSEDHKITQKQRSFLKCQIHARKRFYKATSPTSSFRINCLSSATAHLKIWKEKLSSWSNKHPAYRWLQIILSKSSATQSSSSSSHTLRKMCTKLSNTRFGAQLTEATISLTQLTGVFSYSSKRTLTWSQKSTSSSAWTSPNTFVVLQRWWAESTTSKSIKTFGSKMENGQDRSTLNGFRSKISQTLSSSTLRTLWTRTDLLAKVETAKKSIQKLERKCSSYFRLSDQQRSSSMISNSMMSKRNSELFETSIKAHSTTEAPKSTRMQMQSTEIRPTRPLAPPSLIILSVPSRPSEIPACTLHLISQLNRSQRCRQPQSSLQLQALAQMLPSVPYLSVQPLQPHNSLTLPNKRQTSQIHQATPPVISTDTRSQRTWSGYAKEESEFREEKQAKTVSSKKWNSSLFDKTHSLTC